VIEAVFEDLKLKREIFEKLDRICKPSTILCTNTSTLDIDSVCIIFCDTIYTESFMPSLCVCAPACVYFLASVCVCVVCVYLYCFCFIVGFEASMEDLVIKCVASVIEDLLYFTLRYVLHNFTLLYDTICYFTLRVT
jgi:hypothetical protein